MHSPAQSTSHTARGHDYCRSMAPPCMSQPPLVLQFAEHSRELSRVSKVPFSCASFWQGLCFAVQIHNSTVIQPAGFGRFAAATSKRFLMAHVSYTRCLLCIILPRRGLLHCVPMSLTKDDSVFLLLAGPTSKGALHHYVSTHV
jgi:hypothetical protein